VTPAAEAPAVDAPVVKLQVVGSSSVAPAVSRAAPLHQYHRYGFDCHRYDRRVERYRLT
jgi:hypothetical protein